MTMKLAIQREAYGSPENHKWLGSSHGADTWESLTLSAAAFAATFPTGVVPSGVVIRKVLATGLYVPYAAGGIGERTFHLATTVDLGVGAAASDTPAAGMWHGQVVVAKLPTNHGLVAAAATAMKLVDYVGTVPA